MVGLQIWRHVPGKALMFLVNLVAATALIFEGNNHMKKIQCTGLADIFLLRV